MESVLFNAIGPAIRACLEDLSRIFHLQNSGMESAYGEMQIMAFIKQDDSCAVGWGGEGRGEEGLGVREDYVILLRFLRLNPLMHHRAKTKIQEPCLCSAISHSQPAFIRIQEYLHLGSMPFK